MIGLAQRTAQSRFKKLMEASQPPQQGGSRKERAAEILRKNANERKINIPRA